MTKVQKLQIRAAEIRSRLAEISGLSDDDFSKEIRQECRKLQEDLSGVETKMAAAIASEDTEERETETDETLTAEQRDIVELRQKVSLARFLSPIIGGSRISGAEAEFRSAVTPNAGDNTIPLAMLVDDSVMEKRVDLPSAAPAIVAINPQAIGRYVFKDALARLLGITVQTVASGTHAVPTITTALSASAEAKGGVAEATAGVIGIQSATPKRISARLAVRAEDLAASGLVAMESALRSNLVAALADEFDSQAINGAGANNQLDGLINQLTDPQDPNDIVTFDNGIATVAGAVDGTWARNMAQVALLVGVDTYVTFASLFRGTDSTISLASQLANELASFSVGAKIADKTGGNIQQAVAGLRGQPDLSAAQIAMWDSISIDDMYTGAASATRFFTIHLLVSDVIVQRSDAFKLVEFKLS